MAKRKNLIDWKDIEFISLRDAGSCSVFQANEMIKRGLAKRNGRGLSTYRKGTDILVRRGGAYRDYCIELI